MNISTKSIIFKTLTLFSFIIFIASCSPVRTRTKKIDIQDKNTVKIDKSNTSTKSENKSKEIVIKKDEVNIIQSEEMDNNNQNSKLINLGNTKFQNIDTTKIVINVEPISNLDFTKNFNQIVILFDKNEYKYSCQKFEEFSNTLPENDSLYFESLFFMGECRIVEELYLQAENTFQKILTGIKVPKDIKQRVYLRLGQIYCIQNKKEHADQMFGKLKNEFPKSIYLQLANCDF